MNCDCNIVLTCCKVKIFLSLSLKATLEIFFSCSYYEIWRKPLTEDFILGLLIFAIILILFFFFRIWSFRGIGNIFFGGGSVFEEIVGWRESRTDIHSRGFTDCCWKQFYRRIRRPMKLLRAYLASIFLVWSSEDGIKEKRRGLLQNFSHDDVLDSCVIWQSETDLGKTRCLYICRPEGSWLNWKETRRGFDQVRHVPQGLANQWHGNRNLRKKKKWVTHC